MGKKIVIALGGNALGNNLPEQMVAVKTTAKAIVDLVEDGNEVVVVHGNGPQVGVINNAMGEFASEHKEDPTPLSVCVAMSQAYIGYDIQNALREEFLNRGGKVPPVVTVVTQVRVDKDDPAFQNPTKPIGRFMTKEEAESEAQKRGWNIKEDAGRGYRRVVPSPIPQRIVELKVVEQLVKAGDIVITVGGGGIPVVETEQGLKGVAAVIDKDRSSALLAQSIGADMLIILTAVDRVCINYNKPDQKELPTMTLEEAEKYIEEKQFAPGSMLPKVQSCMEFVKNNTHGGTALITSLQKAKVALQGETGTIITK